MRTGDVFLPFSVRVCSVCLRIGGPREPPSNPKAVCGGPRSCHRLRRYALVPSKTPRKVILFAHTWHSVRDVYQLAGPNLASFPTSGGSAPPTFVVRFPNVFGTFFYTPGNVFWGAHLNICLMFFCGSELQGNPHPTQRQCPVDLKVVRRLWIYALTFKNVVVKLHFLFRNGSA